MKKLLLLFTVIMLSCSSDDEQGDMRLTIVNNFDLWKITNVSLQNYSFDNLSINGGSSRTFTLSNGIPSGTSDIGISIRYECRNAKDMNASVRADFSEGKTTTITINSTPDDTPDAILQDCYNFKFVVSD